MAHGFNLHVLPKDPVYCPNPDQITRTVKFLCERLEIEGDLTVDGEDELSVEDAIERLRAATQTASGGSEGSVTINDYLSTRLFGWEPQGGDSDENFWSDELKILLTAKPFPYGDWEYEELTCPKCSRTLDDVAELLEEVRVTGSPVSCSCGASTPPEDLKRSSSVWLARFSIVFAGNKGWYYEVARDRDAFKDEDFLKTLQDILGTELEVLAVST